MSNQVIDNTDPATGDDGDQLRAKIRGYLREFMLDEELIGGREIHSEQDFAQFLIDKIRAVPAPATVP